MDVEGDAPVALDHHADLVVPYRYPIALEGRAFSRVANSHFSRTTLTELTESGVRKRMTVPGELRKIFRLR